MGQTERQSERPVVNQIDKFLEQTDRVETDRESDRKVPGAQRQATRADRQGGWYDRYFLLPLCRCSRQ